MSVLVCVCVCAVFEGSFAYVACCLLACLQIYKPGHELGGILSFAFHKESYMSEDDPRVTAENRMSLYKAWAPYWNTTKPYLVEKSPRHLIMTRFLQVCDCL